MASALFEERALAFFKKDKVILVFGGRTKEIIKCADNYI